MLAPNNPSAGVYTSENDNAISQRTFSVSTGVIVAETNRGPVGQRTRITTPTKLFNKFGLKNPQLSFGLNCAEDFLAESTSLYFTRVARNAKYAGLKVATVNNFATTLSLAQGFLDPAQVALTPADIMLVYAENPGEWGDTLYILLVPNVNNPEKNTFFFEIYEGDMTVPVERYECSTYYYKNGLGAQTFVEDVINAQSERVRVRFNWNHVAFSTNPEPDLINAIAGGPEDLSTGEKNGQMFGGTNGDKVTTGDIISNWDLYEDHEEVDVDIMINAGYTNEAIQLKMDEIASNRLDCIAILDAPADRVLADRIIDYRRNSLNLNSSSSALYTPHIMMRDTQNARSYFVPPSGKVAGVFAHTDNVAKSWFAPAGTKRGVLSSVSELSAYYDLGDRNALTENQINFVRELSGHGMVLWNADTLYSLKSPLNDIGVRRLLGILHRIVRFNQLSNTFKPNDTFLRSTIDRQMRDILEPIKRDRGLDWYDVVCDDRNNPDSLIANGDVVCDVYLDPTRYTKRIHLNAVIAKKGGIKFAESVVTRP